MTTTTSSPLFEDVVAAWDEPLRCQTDQTDQPCTSPAAWLAVLHQPCGRKPLCEYHLNRWLLNRIVYPGAVACSVCRRHFNDLDVFARFVRL